MLFILQKAMQSYIISKLLVFSRYVHHHHHHHHQQQQQQQQELPPVRY